MISGLVSVIVPVYNTERYLRRTVESLIGQTSSCIEIILVDDGSTDRSGELCDDLSQQDSRIKVFHQTNKGVSAARNLGLRNVRGEYIMFVDSDDELPADSVDNLLSASKNTQYDLVIGGLFVSENGKKRLVSLNQESYNNFDLANEIVTYSNDGIAAFVMSSSCGKLYKNEIINNNNIIFNENLQAGEDGIFVAEYLYVSKKVFNVFLPSYIIHRMTPNERISATSSVYSDIFEFRCMYFQNLWEILRDNSSDTEQRYFMQMALQKLIGDLVIAGAYNDFYLRGELYAKMEKFLEIPFIREASLIYRRKRAADSVWIPLFLRYRQPRLLCIAMKIRGQAYIKARGKSRFVKSIYRIGK